MNSRARVVLFGAGAVVLAVAYVLAAHRIPGLGAVPHPYGVRAVRAAVAHRTPNAISSVSFDQRGFDTLGEEFILVMAVLGTVLLLRQSRAEHGAGGDSDASGADPGAVRLVGYLMLPLTCLLGGYLIAHGHLSPGGGFQGGVALATAVHLLYLAGNRHALDRFRRLPPFEASEAIGAGGFVLVGILGLAMSAPFLTNVLPLGTYRALLSAGTVPVLNVLAGTAVMSGLMVLLGEFLEQAVLVRGRGKP